MSNKHRISLLSNAPSKPHIKCELHPTFINTVRLIQSRGIDWLCSGYDVTAFPRGHQLRLVVSMVVSNNTDEDVDISESWTGCQYMTERYIIHAGKQDTKVEFSIVDDILHVNGVDVGIVNWKYANVLVKIARRLDISVISSIYTTNKLALGLHSLAESLHIGACTYEAMSAFEDADELEDVYPFAAMYAYAQGYETYDENQCDTTDDDDSDDDEENDDDRKFIDDEAIESDGDDEDSDDEEEEEEIRERLARR